MKYRIILLAAVTLFTTSSVFSQTKELRNIGIGEVSIIEQIGGDVWAGSAAQGVGFYSGSSQTWTYYNHSTTSQFTSDSITSIVARSTGNTTDVLFGTASGVVEFKNGMWSVPSALSGKRISCISLIGVDTIWVATVDQGLFVVDTMFTVMKTFNTSNSVIPVTQIKAGQRGGRTCSGYCAAAPDSGLIYTDFGFQYVVYDTTVAHFGLVNNYVNTVWRDNNCDSDRWIVGTRGGFSLCPDSMPCINFTTANGLSENNITSVAQDCRGYIWLGTADSGVMVYNGTSFRRITTANGLTSNQVTAITFAAGSCTGYVATADGNIAELDTTAQVTQVLNSLENITASELNVAVYPQPGSSLVTFAFGKTITGGELILTDISGRIVQNVLLKNTNSTVVNVSALPAGVYIYHISGSGQFLKTGRVSVMD